MTKIVGATGGQCLRDLSSRPPECKKWWGAPLPRPQSPQNFPDSCRQPAAVNLACPQLPIWGGGTPPPPPLRILYLYCYSKTGQDQGNFRALEDKLRHHDERKRALTITYPAWTSPSPKPRGGI